MIEGIPDGWELVRIGKPVKGVDWVVAPEGFPVAMDWATDRHNLVIIRKKPKQYRPFANAAEAMPFWDAKLKEKKSGVGVFRVVAMGDENVGIGFTLYTYREAFEKYECDDGTPFGVEI